MRLASRTIELTPEDHASEPYRHIDVDVPAGTGSVEVEITYDTTAAVIDLGCESPRGWRGWSGAARTRFVIGEREATPGYLPGEIEAGVWLVVLGLHEVPPEGVSVQVEMHSPARAPAEPDPDAAVVAGPPRGSTRALPADDGLTWYAADLHAHTVHSDGALGVGELAAQASTAGLDVIAVTDHNTVSHHAALPGVGARHDVTLLAGQEVTTSLGHANVYGDVGFVDFRRPATHWARHAREHGGVFSVNHPLYRDCAWQHPLDGPPDAVEVWHVSWFLDLFNTAPLAYLTQVGGRPALLGGSDYHYPEQGWRLGTPTTWIAATDASAESIMAGLAAGRTAISVGVRTDRTTDPLGTPVLVRVGDALIADRAEGLELVDAAGGRRRVTSPRQEFDGQAQAGPYRLESPALGVLAISW